MPYADELDTASAISSMADDLDQQADVVTRGLNESSSMGIGPGNIAGDQNAIAPGYDASQVTDATGPEGGVPLGNQPFGPSAGAGMGSSSGPDTIPFSENPAILDQLQKEPTDLGDKPSLQALQDAIGSVEGGPEMGGGPADMIAGLMGEEEVAEEVAPGEEVATFLSDFDRGMSAKSPAGMISQGGVQEQSPGVLEAQFAGDPTMGGGPQDIRNVVQPGAQFAAGVPQGPYTQESQVTEQQLADTEQKLADMQQEVAKNRAILSDMQRFNTSPRRAEAFFGPPLGSGAIEQVADIPGSLRNRNIQSQMGGGPSDVHEAPGGSWDYEAGRINEPAPKSTMERLYEGITNLGGSEMGAGGPDVPGMLRHDAGYDVVRDPHSTAMGTPNQAYLASQAGPDIPGVTSFEGTPVDQVTVSGGTVASQDVAPKYSGKTVTVETQDQMYPGHKNFATMAGVSSILSTIDGSHEGWIEAVNDDMEKRGIVLDHEINGVKTGKHSSGNWKEYSALFDPETGLDSNGVPMPGTAGAPVEEVAVKPNLPDLSFLPPNFEDITPEIRARMERVVNEWRAQQQGASAPLETGANTFGADYDRTEPTRVAGDDTRGDNPVDIIRSTYAWASSLPNNVLFNAARYPDYLRLLIEYDAAGKDLPLTVPTWILEGTARPAEDDEEQTSLFANHPAMQTQELTWAT
jgi:hypothetical protein